MSKIILQRTTMYYSFNEFFVYDPAIGVVENALRPEDFRKGYVAIRGLAGFVTLDEFGDASTQVFLGRCEDQNVYDFIVEVPFEVVSGVVTIEGPDEYNSGRGVGLDAGHYALVAAQSLVGEGHEVVDLWFEPVTAPMRVGRVLRADSRLGLPSDDRRRE